MSDLTTSLAFMFGGMEVLIIVLVLALLIFGKRIPELARSLGKSVVEFKSGLKETEDKKTEESSKSE